MSRDAERSGARGVEGGKQLVASPPAQAVHRQQWCRFCGDFVGGLWEMKCDKCRAAAAAALVRDVQGYMVS